MRVGLGFDVHRLAEGDGVILGGVSLPSDKKLVGHSDGDALCHAFIDALLGAAALGDIGMRFPDTDPKYKGASSVELLKQVGREVAGAGYKIVNIDSVVVARAPKLSDHREAIINKISDALGLGPRQVSVKGKTAEGLGVVGAGEALCAQAVALVEEVE